jgi:hypothetical protein
MRIPRTLVVAAALAVGLAFTAAVPPAAAVGSAAPTAGLVLHYSFETIDAGAVPDVSGNSHNGRVVAQPGSRLLVTGLAGYGRALNLRGDSHQYVDVAASPLLDVDRHTVSAWVRYTGDENDKTFGRWEVLEKAGAYWANVRTDGRVRGGGYFGGCTAAAWQYLDSTRAVVPLRWTHVASTYDGAWLRLYIDGRAAGAKQVTGRTCVSGEPLAVGAKNNPTKGILEAFWDGRLDEVRIYSRALSAAEITSLAARP